MLTKVRLEYDDGTWQELEGEQAMKWEAAMWEVRVFVDAHGENPFSNLKLNWSKGKTEQDDTNSCQ